MFGDCGLRRSFMGSGMVALHSCILAAAFDQPLLDLRNGLAWVQSLGTGAGAIQNGVATVEPKWVFQAVQPFFHRFVATVGEPAPSLEKHGRPKKAIAVPPVARAARRAAEAEDALVIAVEPRALLDRLEALLLGSWRFRLKPGLDHLVLRKDVIEIGDKVLDDGHVRERVDLRGTSRIGDEARACQPIGAVDVHGAGAADAFAARAAKGERGVDVVLDPDQRVEHHRPAFVEIDFKRIDPWALTGVWIIAVNLEGLGALGLIGSRPCPAPLDTRLRPEAEVSRHRKSFYQCEPRELI